MSSTNTTTAVDYSPIVEVYGTYLLQEYIATAAAVLLFFEYIITLDREIEMFWRRKFSGATALFLANRYTILANAILVPEHLVIGLAGTDEMYALSYLTAKLYLTKRRRTIYSCNRLEWGTLITSLLPLVPWAAFSTMRTFALSKSKALSVVVCALSLVPLGTNLSQVGSGFSGYYDPFFGCLEYENTPPEQVYIGHVSTFFRLTTTSTVLVASRGALILADALLIVLSWWKLSYHASGLGKVILGSRRLTIPGIMLRDGTIYFVMLLTLNVLHLAFTLASVLDNGFASDITLFTSPLTSILISRFLMNLQEANLRPVRVDSDDPLHFSIYADASLPSFVAASVVPGRGMGIQGFKPERTDTAVEVNE